MEISKDTFIQAVQEENIETVKSGLSKNPSLINTKTEQGLSILLLAMYYRKNDIVNVLLENKKEFDFFEAAAAGQLDFVKKHLEKQPEILNQYASDGFTALGLSCFFNQKEIADFLIQKGADPNIASNNDFKVTPLHSAAHNGAIELVKLLLQNGADIYAKTVEGQSALDFAKEGNSTKIINLLIK